MVESGIDRLPGVLPAGRGRRILRMEARRPHNTERMPMQTIEDVVPVFAERIMELLAEGRVKEARGSIMDLVSRLNALEREIDVAEQLARSVEVDGD